MATHSYILAWRIPWTEEPGGLQSTGSQKNGTWLKWLSTHQEFYHRLWLKPWEGNGKRKEKIRVRITEREVVGNCTKCCGIGSLRRKHPRRDTKGRKWPSNRVSAGAWGRSHASFGQNKSGRRGRLHFPKGSVSFRRPVSSLPPLASIFPCRPDSIGIKTEVLNVFKSPSLLYTLLLSEITFIYPMGMSPGGWPTPLPPVPQVEPCDPILCPPHPPLLPVILQEVSREPEVPTSSGNLCCQPTWPIRRNSYLENNLLGFQDPTFLLILSDHNFWAHFYLIFFLPPSESSHQQMEFFRA